MGLEMFWRQEANCIASGPSDIYIKLLSRDDLTIKESICIYVGRLAIDSSLWILNLNKHTITAPSPANGPIRGTSPANQLYNIQCTMASAQVKVKLSWYSISTMSDS